MHYSFALIAIFVNGIAVAKPPSLDRLTLPSCDFSRIFHKIASQASTTTLRKELKVTVDVDAANSFISDVARLVGDKRLKYRETPPSKEEIYITETDYLPVFKGADSTGQEVFKAYIRQRKYTIVPEGTRTKDLGIAKKRPQKLTDQDGEYVKLEFKVGHPEMDSSTGDMRDLSGVVDKPGIVILSSDAEKLFKSKTSFQRELQAVTDRTNALTLTNSEGITRPVNKPGEVRSLLERIGNLHEQEFPMGALTPHHQTLYHREARTIEFDHPPQMVEQGLTGKFEVQITVDADILVNEYGTGASHAFKDTDRVIELKIPTSYANLPDSELRNMGLGNLARLRNMYLNLNPIQGTIRDRGKTKNAPARADENR